MSNYLKIVEKTKPKKRNEQPRPASPNRQTSGATKETKATKVPVPTAARKELPCDKSDRSDQRVPNFTPLTISEALAEINRWGSGAGRNAELFRAGELSEEMAVEYVTCSILHRRGESFEVWRHHAPAVRKALSLCIHELPPEVCKVCNGYVKKLIEQGGAA
ncbi:MAG: hypothetical protein WKF67_11105 [Rubrobacteraceae bacterium]